MLPRFLSKLPIFNFVVATTALGFQVAVLYPWHHELSQQNQKLALQITLLELEVKEIRRMKELEAAARAPSSGAKA